MKRRKEKFYTVYEMGGTTIILCHACRSMKFYPVPLHMPECNINRNEFAAAIRRIRNEERENA